MTEYCCVPNVMLNNNVMGEKESLTFEVLMVHKENKLIIEQRSLFLRFR